MNRIIINEIKNIQAECKNKPNISAEEIIETIIDLVNKFPGDPSVKKINKWFPKKEYIDTLFKIYSTKQVTNDDKLVVLEIYNTFIELLK